MLFDIARKTFNHPENTIYFRAAFSLQLGMNFSTFGFTAGAWDPLLLRCDIFNIGSKS